MTLPKRVVSAANILSSSSSSSVASSSSSSVVAATIPPNRGVRLTKFLLSSKLICYSSPLPLAAEFPPSSTSSTPSFARVRFPTTKSVTPHKTGKFVMDGRISCDCCDRTFFPTTFTAHHAGNKAEKPLDALKVLLPVSSGPFSSPLTSPDSLSSSSLDDYFPSAASSDCSVASPLTGSRSLRDVLQTTPSWASLRIFQHFGLDGNDFANKKLFEEEFDASLPPMLLEDDQPYIAVKENGSTLYQRLDSFLNHEEIKSHFSDVDSDLSDFLAPYEVTPPSSSRSSIAECYFPSFLYTPPLSSSPGSSPLHSDPASSFGDDQAQYVPPTSTFSSLPPAYFHQAVVASGAPFTPAVTPSPILKKKVSHAGVSKRGTPASLSTPFLLTPAATPKASRTRREIPHEAESDQEDSDDPDFAPSQDAPASVATAKTAGAKSSRSRSRSRSTKSKSRRSSPKGASSASSETHTAGENTGDSHESGNSGRGSNNKGAQGSPAGSNFRLEVGSHQISVLVLRHQGNNGSHPRNKGQYYFQARIRNVYPQRHLWAGWETPEGMEARVRDMLEK